MWNDIFNIAISNGLFAALFVALLVYVLKDSRKRENKYQGIIDSLSEHLNTVDEIKQDVADIKILIRSGSKNKKRSIKND